MNSVFVNSGIYSCAVDAFLEISTQFFLPYLSNLLLRNVPYSVYMEQSTANSNSFKIAQKTAFEVKGRT